MASPNSARVVNVGASDRADTRASFSNFGSKVHLYAPGVNILGTYVAPDPRVVSP